MTTCSRGKVAGYEPPAPLTKTQKERIATYALAGWRDRQIAEYLGIGEGRVAHYRSKIGVSGERNRGSHGDKLFASPVRPRHVAGDVGDDEWWRSNDDAFRVAVEAALTTGGW